MSRKEKKLISVYISYIAAPMLFTFITVMASIALIVSYRFTDFNRAYIIALLVLLSVSLVLYVLIVHLSFRKLRHIFYDQLFGVTIDNMRHINADNINLSSYGDSDIKEIKMLNDSTLKLKEKLANSYIVSNNPSYDKLSLEYVNKDKNLITFNSFRANLKNIIFISQSYRNLIIEVYYRLPSSFDVDNKTRLLDIYTEAFKDHNKALFMFGEDDRSLIIYLPVIDSFSEIKEKLELLASNSSIMVRDDRGVKNIPAQYALVSYPHSNEDVILGDLRYAKRLNKPYLLYLPNRLRNNTNKVVLSNSSMNMNYMTKIFEELSALDYYSLNNERNIKVLNSVLTGLCNYLNIEEAGILNYSSSDNKYHLYAKADHSELFSNDIIPEDFISALESSSDDDNTYYFSSRSHANSVLKREIDMYGITSGFYFIIKDFYNEKTNQIIYLFNRSHNLSLDSYLRECLFMMSLRIEGFFEKREISEYAQAKDNENESILALSNLYVYTVDNDYKVISHSKNMKKLFPQVKDGNHCYKCFFDADKPCVGCPLRSFKKKYFEHNNMKYESSTVLDDRRANYTTLCIKPINDELESGDLYQNNLLVYTFKSLVDTIKNEYYANSRGYLVLLRIDNYDQLVANKGTEAFDYVVREYVKRLKNKLNLDDIYFYNASTLALHLPLKGHADIINIIESIYPVSKEVTNYNDNDILNISYLPVGYPRGYANARDFLKHVSEFYRNPTLEKNKDFIYFADFSIARSANKHDFIVSVIKDEFSNQTSQNVYLQPTVRASDSRIVGAEMLLRINDSHRNIFFNAAEISSIAEEENLTHLIAESTVKYVGDLYKEYGKGLFKTNNLKNIAINIDQTYLKDKSLILNLINLASDNDLPDNFISLEIPEDIIAHNYDAIKDLAIKLKSRKTVLACDRYLGEYTDIDHLIEAGIGEIKIARDLVSKIASDPIALTNFTNMVNTAFEKGLRVSCVGVENEEQFKLIKNISGDINVQGYYFYKPLTRSDFIAALISYNK